MLKLSHYNSIYFLSYVHPRYMKYLSTNIKYKLHRQITREFLGLRMRSFQNVVFKWSRTYSEICKFALH